MSIITKFKDKYLFWVIGITATFIFGVKMDKKYVGLTKISVFVKILKILPEVLTRSMMPNCDNPN